MVGFHVENDPDPGDIGFLETQIRREASATTGLGDEVELAIFVREAGRIVAGVSGWTWEERELFYRMTLPKAACVVVGSEEGRRQIERLRALRARRGCLQRRCERHGRQHRWRVPAPAGGSL